MTDPHTVGRRDSVAWAARVALARLEHAIGTPGRRALRARPHLTWQVDQHSAEVRDALGGADGIAVTALAAYADGVGDVAAARGIDPVAAATASWDGPSWPLLRLLAVCLLAEGVQRAS